MTGGVLFTYQSRHYMFEEAVLFIASFFGKNNYTFIGRLPGKSCVKKCCWTRCWMPDAQKRTFSISSLFSARGFRLSLFRFSHLIFGECAVSLMIYSNEQQTDSRSANRIRRLNVGFALRNAIKKRQSKSLILVFEATIDGLYVGEDALPVWSAHHHHVLDIK